MDQKQVFKTVADDFAAVNTLIYQKLTSDVPLVEKIADYIISSGGKRLRPLLVLLAASVKGPVSSTHHLLAAIIEFLHTATLLHDDVVDQSAQRRGQPTANTTWGNAPSVLVGDFLYARSFEMLVELNNRSVMGLLSRTTRRIAEGEVMQLMNIENPELTEADYLRVISAKTAALFEASAASAGIISGYEEAEVEALGTYALNLGLAFQLIDDVLDYAGDTATLGKEIGDDLAEGKPTLPFIHAISCADPATKRRLAAGIRNTEKPPLADFIAMLNSLGSIEYTEQRAVEHCARAKESLSIFADSTPKQALLALADIAVQRRS